MPNKLKGLVSKKKIRFQKDGFDLDLTYITTRVIAMGYPAQSWEGIYRNHIDDVVSFFKKRHEGHYQIYNLCNERHIDEQKFEPYTINHSYPFDDHNPPRFSQMLKCCEGIQSYLDCDAENIVAVQCKAGKGRTGVIVCSYLLLAGHSKTATESLQFYGRSRTTNGKGVTIPSQIRYIYYFDHLLRNNLTYRDIFLKFSHLVLEELPNIAGNGYEIQVIVYGYDKTDKMREYHSSQFYEVKRDSQRSLKLCPDEDWVLHGDLKFQIVLKSKFGKKENLCHCWLNTFFVVHKPPVLFFDDKSANNKLDVHYSVSRKSVRTKSELPERPKPTYMLAIKDRVSPNNGDKSYKFTVQKQEIDKANKDVNNKIFPSNFAMSFVFECYTPCFPVIKNCLKRIPTDHRNGISNSFVRSKVPIDTNHIFNSVPSSNESGIQNSLTRHDNLYSTKMRCLLAGGHSSRSGDDNSDNGDQRSESSESSTKDSLSDFDELG